jgi:DNA repair exonuclease SbcCD ATPase subunit
MEHRRWIERDVQAMSSLDAAMEQNSLYLAYCNAIEWKQETLDENNRLDRELDAARKCIAELESPARVPFGFEKVDSMAQAAFESMHKSSRWEFADQWIYHVAIRAALAAGCLEPCAVSEYEPADVALAPTGHVLRDRLVEAERKVENQRAELKRLNAQLADLRAEVDEDNAAAASVNDLLVQVQNLTAERDRLAAENAELWSSRPAETAYLDLSNRQLIIDYEQALKGLAAADATLDRLREVVPKVLPPHMSWKDSLDGARAILYPPETTNDDR